MITNPIQCYALPPQESFVFSPAQFAGLFGGIGSGKSHAGCFWAMLKAMKNPRCVGLIGANSYRQLHDATLRTFETLLQTYGIGYTFQRSADMSFRLENGAEVLCRSMENFDLLRGIELGWFYLDEVRDTRFEAWQVIKGRLRAADVDARQGRVTSSPNGFDWIYDEFVTKPSDPATAAAYANHAAFFARTAENWYLPPDYVAALLASYDPLLAEQELDGRFVNTTSGRIYRAFDRAAHVTSEADLVPGQPILWALDFNVTPMTAIIAQWDECRVTSGKCQGQDACRAPSPLTRHLSLATCPSLRVVDEIWLTHAGTMAMCEAFGEWLAASVKCRVTSDEGKTGATHAASPLVTRHSSLVPVLVFGDAAGAARSTSGKSDYAIIRQAFPEARLCVPAANPQRRDRYNAVNVALRDGAGRVRLRIHPRCRRLIEDLERVVFQGNSGTPDASDPMLGHISDALGYLVVREMPAGRARLTVGRW